MNLGYRLLGEPLEVFAACIFVLALCYPTFALMRYFSSDIFNQEDVTNIKQTLLVIVSPLIVLTAATGTMVILGIILTI